MNQQVSAKVLDLVKAEALAQFGLTQCPRVQVAREWHRALENQGRSSGKGIKGEQLKKAVQNTALGLFENS